jgi:hypothetical protein
VAACPLLRGICSSLTHVLLTAVRTKGNHLPLPVNVGAAERQNVVRSPQTLTRAANQELGFPKSTHQKVLKRWLKMLRAM